MPLNPNTTDLINHEPIISTENELHDLEAEISEIMTGNPDLAGEDITVLLERLTSADNMARGMENKIDGVLQDLDNLLDILSSSANVADNVETVDDTTQTHVPANTAETA